MKEFVKNEFRFKCFDIDGFGAGEIYIKDDGKTKVLRFGIKSQWQEVKKLAQKLSNREGMEINEFLYIKNKTKKFFTLEKIMDTYLLQTEDASFNEIKVLEIDIQPNKKFYVFKHIKNRALNDVEIYTYEIVWGVRTQKKFLEAITIEEFKKRHPRAEWTYDFVS